MMIMMKKNLHTTHTHKYIWCIFLEISKWGVVENGVKNLEKTRARARASYF